MIKGLVAIVCALGVSGTAAAQVPLPPLPPDPTQPPPDNPPPPDSRPPPAQPPSTPQPISTAPGSVADGVDVAHSGFLSDEALVPPLVQRWSKELNVGFVLAADGRVYTAGRNVVALDQATGKRVWSASLKKVSYQRAVGAAYDSGFVFVTTSDDIRAYHADSGKLAWRRELHGEGSPVATGGTVYVGHGYIIEALRASDGSLLWRYQTQNGTGTPALDDRRAYVVGGCGETEAVDRSTGAPIWHHEGSCSGGVMVVPALFGGRLWVPGLESITRNTEIMPVLSAADGSLVGRFNSYRPVFVDGLAVLPRDEKGVRALDAATGKQVWRKRTHLYGPVAVGHDIYGVGSGRVVALDSETGTTFWSADLRGAETNDYSTNPVLAAAPGLLLVAASGRLTAYESALRPAPGRIALGAGSSDVIAGRTFILAGVLGTQLRGARPRVTVRAAGWRHGAFRRVGRVGSARDGGFGIAARSDRNARWRVTAGGSRSNVVTVYTYPSVRLGRPRAVGTTRASVNVAVSAPRAKLSGRRVVLYLQQSRRGRLVRLGSGRMRGARGRGKATVVYGLPRHVRRGALLWHCVTGQLRMKLGRPSPLTRRCGTRVLRRP